MVVAGADAVGTAPAARPQELPAARGAAVAQGRVRYEEALRGGLVEHARLEPRRGRAARREGRRGVRGDEAWGGGEALGGARREGRRGVRGGERIKTLIMRARKYRKCAYDK